MTAAERLFAEALALPEDERIALAERLLAVTPDPRIEQAWAEEATRRLAEYDSGAARGMSVDEALKFMTSTKP